MMMSPILQCGREVQRLYGDQHDRVARRLGAVAVPVDW